jgi:hypothetical protein
MRAGRKRPTTPFRRSTCPTSAASQCVRDVGDSGDSKEQQPAYDDLDEPLYFHHHNLPGSDAELDVDMTITEKQVAGH